MPLIIFILIVVLIAQVGFWDTLGAVLGAGAMVLLLFVLLIAVAALTARYWYLKIRRSL